MMVLSRAGFPMPAPVDDTMLISYAQEAGLHGHGLDELSQLHLGHTPISFDEVTGTGRNRVPFAQVQIDRATAHAAEDADMALRLWEALRPRLRLNGGLALYEQVERRLVPILLEMERAGIKVDADDLRRMSVDFEARMAVMETGLPSPGGPSVQCRQPEAVGRGAVRRTEAARRQTDEDRRLGNRLRSAANAGRTGARAAEPHPGMAAIGETEIHLCRFAGQRHQSGDRASAYVVSRWRSPRPGACPRTTRTCRTSRSARRKAAASATHLSPNRAMCWSARTTRRSSCGCWRTSPICRC